MRNAILLGMVLMTACKSKEEARPASEPPKATPAPANESAVTTPAEFETKGTAMVAEMVAIMKSTATDCDARAAQLNAWMERRNPLLLAINAYAIAHPDEDKALDAKLEKVMDPLTEHYRTTPGAQTCEEHAGFTAAMARLP